MVVVVMGVSGSGKTTVGNALAKKLNVPFFDADDFHSEANVEKMKQGIALTDIDRQPWLESLAKHIKTWEANEGAVLACSALKEDYRNMLSSTIKTVQWVYLSGSFDSIKQRMEQRQQHYMKSDLLQSQFDTLEIPEYGIHVSIEHSVEDILSKITSKL